MPDLVKILRAITLCEKEPNKALRISVAWPGSWVEHAKANRRLERYNAAIRTLRGLVGK